MKSSTSHRAAAAPASSSAKAPPAKHISRVLVNQSHLQHSTNGPRNSSPPPPTPSPPSHLMKVIAKQQQDDTNYTTGGPVEQVQPASEAAQWTEREDLEERQSLRQVYLFNCCGLTRELRPAHEYMPTFKTLFTLFNALLFLFAFANFGMGLWFRIDPKVYEIHKYIETQNYTIAGWIMLFGGFLACVTSLVACLATSSKPSIGLLLCYMVTMVLVNISFCCNIIMLTIYGLGSNLERFLIKELYEQIRRRSVNTESELFLASSEAVQFMDFVQVKMRCCGALDFRDYSRLGMVIPTSCYTIEGNYVNSPGCGRAIRRLMDIRAGMAVGFSTGSVLCQQVALVLCGLMICSIYNWRATPTRPDQMVQ